MGGDQSLLDIVPLEVAFVRLGKIMAALPYIQLYVAEYLADTQHLTLEEHGAYLLLIMNYWQRGKALVDSDKRMASVCSTDVERWLAIRSTLEEFFTIKDGFWTHNRIEKDLEKVHKKSKQAQEAGKKSAEKKKKNQEVPTERSTDVDVPLQRGANHTDTDTDTDTEKKKEEKPPLPPGGGKPRSFKSWTVEEFRQEIDKASDGILTEEEADEFFAYWTEPNGSGRPRYSLEKTWETVRRMKNAVAMVYSKRRMPARAAPPRLTGRQAYMVEVGNMLEELEDRKNGINIATGTGILDAPRLALP